MAAHGDHLGAVFPDANVDRRTIPCGFIFLVTWRIARRFGGRGLAVVAFVAAVLGPVRDYRYMATFPGVPTRQGLHPCLQFLYAAEAFRNYLRRVCFSR
jgi:hypothetical protein